MARDRTRWRRFVDAICPIGDKRRWCWLYNYRLKKCIFRALILSCPRHYHIIRFTQQKKNKTQSLFRFATRHNPDTPQTSAATHRNSDDRTRITKALAIPRCPTFEFWSEYVLKGISTNLKILNFGQVFRYFYPLCTVLHLLCALQNKLPKIETFRCFPDISKICY
jgi:hypothetical protein